MQRTREIFLPAPHVEGPTDVPSMHNERVFVTGLNVLACEGSTYSFLVPGEPGLGIMDSRHPLLRAPWRWYDWLVGASEGRSNAEGPAAPQLASQKVPPSPSHLLPCQLPTLFNPSPHTHCRRYSRSVTTIVDSGRRRVAIGALEHLVKPSRHQLTTGVSPERKDCF